MYENILTEVSRGVGIITLNRPERHNAFDDRMIGELTAATAAMEADSAVRVLVISSTGKSFCAGADVNWMRRAANITAQDSLNDARALAQMLRALAQMGKPTIARVQGPACGGGVGLVAACDVAIATYEAQFTLSEVILGIVPAVIGPHLIAAIGERCARRYMLTAEPFAAAEAYRMGLLHEIVPDEASLDEAVGEIVDSLLANGPRALAACKALIHAVAGRPLEAALIEDTAQRSAAIRSTEEAQEGMAAYLQQRKPSWVPLDSEDPV